MQKVMLLTYTPNPEDVVSSAAKLCYSQVGVEEIMKKQSKENRDKFIEKLVNIGHLSPFEHASFTFAIEGVSRVLTHQLVRHRLASYSQQSQRYVKEDSFDYIVPPAIRDNEKAKEIFLKHMEYSQKAYDELVIELIYEKLLDSNSYHKWIKSIIAIENINKKMDEQDWGEYFLSNAYENSTFQDYEDILKYITLFKKLSPKEFTSIEKQAIEDARYIFPNATETKIVLTMNARSLMNFFNLRCCNRAQWEIRDLADTMLREVYRVAPGIFGSSGAPCTFGKCPEGDMTCKKVRKFEDIIGI